MEDYGLSELTNSSKEFSLYSKKFNSTQAIVEFSKAKKDSAYAVPANNHYDSDDDSEYDRIQKVLEQNKRRQRRRNTTFEGIQVSLDKQKRKEKNLGWQDRLVHEVDFTVNMALPIKHRLSIEEERRPYKPYNPFKLK